MEFNEELAGLKSQNEALRAEIASLRNDRLEETELVEEAQKLITCITSYQKFIRLANGQAKDEEKEKEAEEDEYPCVPGYNKCGNCGKPLCKHCDCDTCEVRCDQCLELFCSSCLSYNYCHKCTEESTPDTPPTMEEMAINFSDNRACDMYAIKRAKEIYAKFNDQDGDIVYLAIKDNGPKPRPGENNMNATGQGGYVIATSLAPVKVIEELEKTRISPVIVLCCDSLMTWVGKD